MIAMVTNAPIPARDLLAYDPHDIEKLLPKRVDVLFEDGKVVNTTSRALTYSWYIWEFHRRYPFLPLNYEHHIDSVLNGQLLSSNTHIDLLGRVSKELILKHGMEDSQNKEAILELIYYVTNQLHNELPTLASRYVATIDILDILALAKDPDILAMKAKMEPTATGIADFYAKAHKIILEDPKYKTNNLVQFIRMKILNMNQVNQCVLARGFPIEVTGTILSTAITSNYVTGMYKLYDYVAESRGAAKHLYSAEAPLQDTEYFARRLQLAGMVVEGIVQGDCGTTEYLPWHVKPPVFTQTGRTVYDGDRKFMKGKLYLDESTGQLKEITGKETHLDGTTIKLRSVLFCKEKNPHYVCSHCFGMLHHNVSRFANLGHLCDATLTQQLTQTILSTKHLIGSAVGTEIFLKEDAQKYLMFLSNTMSFHLKPNTRESNLKLVVNRNTAIGLTDLKLLDTIDQISPKRISMLDDIEIRETLPNGATVTTQIHLEQNNRYGYFSKEFLLFVRENGWTTNEYDHFVFDLTGWNPKHPIIGVPDMEYSYADHAAQIANLIESNTKKLQARSQATAPQETLSELFDLVNSKISVNIALLEVMIYANMTQGVDNYGMARHHQAGLNVARFIISHRSLGPAYAYQNQFETIASPRSFFQENRPDSPIDVFLAPREVVAHRKKQLQAT